MTIATGKIDARICSRTRYHADDVQKACGSCERPVYLRPHGPMDVPLICLDCFVKQSQERKS